MKMPRLSPERRFLAGNLLSHVNYCNEKAMTQKRSQRLAGGFTLVEIMIVVSVIALLAAIAVPGFLRARKRSQATRVLEDLRLIEAAVSVYAIEKSKTSGTTLIFSDLQPYLKRSSPLYNTAETFSGTVIATLSWINFRRCLPGPQLRSRMWRTRHSGRPISDLLMLLLYKSPSD
jgi:prepilin-type N-terminal cleavage/methylation domain-containing protein